MLDPGEKPQEASPPNFCKYSTQPNTFKNDVAPPSSNVGFTPGKYSLKYGYYGSPASNCYFNNIGLPALSDVKRLLHFRGGGGTNLELISVSIYYV